MSITIIKHSKATPHKAIDYVLNPEKSIDSRLMNLEAGIDPAKQFLLTADLFKQNKSRNARKYYHGKLSFDAADWDKNGGRVGSEEALNICQKLVDEFFPGYEVVLSAHGDTDNLHVHFVVNSVSFETGKKIDMNDKKYREFKDRAQEIFQKEGLKYIDWRQAVKDKRELQKDDEIIPGSEEVLTFAEKGMRERNFQPETPADMQKKSKFSWKDELRVVIDYAADNSTSMAEFNEILQHYGVETPRNTAKTISYKHPNQSKSVRGDTLGANYTKAYIVEKVAQNFREHAAEIALNEKLADMAPIRERPSLAMMLNNAASVNGGHNEDKEQAELEQTKKNIDWINERRERNDIKAYEIYLKTTVILEEKCGSGWHNKAEWSELNQMLRETQWLDTNLVTEKDKMYKLLVAWNDCLDEGASDISDIERAKRANYVRWSGCDPEDREAFDDLMHEYELIHYQMAMNKELREALVATADEWKDSNELIRAQNQLEKAKYAKDQNNAFLKKMKKNRKKLKQIADACYYSATRRTGQSYIEAIKDEAIYVEGNPWYKYKSVQNSYEKTKRNYAKAKSQKKERNQQYKEAKKHLKEVKKQQKQKKKDQFER